jgi:ATP-dependent DNA helicase 2 subunit 2
VARAILILSGISVPRKVAKTRKDDHVLARDDDEEMLLLDQIPKVKRSASQYAGPSQAWSKLVKDEDTDDDEDLLKPRTQRDGTKREVSPAEIIDRGRAPGRIIGSTFPLEDFKKNISRGDLVTKAVEDLAWVVQDIVLKPFAPRRHQEMIECLQVLRATAIKVTILRLYCLKLH